MSKTFALSVKALIRDKAGRYLVLQRSAASKNNAGKWDLPGGKVDSGESFDAALIREVYEETSLNIELDSPAGVATSDLASHVVTYLIMEAHLVGGSFSLSTEHSAHQWVARADLSRTDFCAQFVPFVRNYATSKCG